jgi:hypothetical protein
MVTAIAIRKNRTSNDHSEKLPLLILTHVQVN